MSEQHDSMIEASAQRLFSDNADKAVIEAAERGEFPQQLWQLVADSGFPVALVSEDAGGIGESWAGAYPILRGIGYWQVPLPLAETMVAGLLLSRAGIEVPEGPIALAELPPTGGTSPAKSGTITGTATHVAWARHCGHLVVSEPGRPVALVALGKGAKGVRIEERVDISRMPSDTVHLEGAPVIGASSADLFPGIDRPVRTFGALARAIQMVGALEWVLEQSVQYANDRVQFGRPIGKYQAIQQQLALLAGDVAASRMAALVAANDAPSATAEGSDGPDAGARAVFSTAAAKIRVGEAATRACSIAHQVHGAIGFTYEHALQFGTRRLWTWREEFGADSWWAQRLGEAVIQAGKQGFWSGITARNMGQGLSLSAKAAR